MELLKREQPKNEKLNALEKKIKGMLKAVNSGKTNITHDVLDVMGEIRKVKKESKLIPKGQLWWIERDLKVCRDAATG